MEYSCREKTLCSYSGALQVGWRLVFRRSDPEVCRIFGVHVFGGRQKGTDSLLSSRLPHPPFSPSPFLPTPSPPSLFFHRHLLPLHPPLSPPPRHWHYPVYVIPQGHLVWVPLAYLYPSILTLLTLLTTARSVLPHLSLGVWMERTDGISPD